MTELAVMSAGHTRTGRRPLNQDAVLIRELSRGRRLLAVADGMGGHNAGEEASRLALEALCEALEDGYTLAASVVRTNARVYRAGRDDPALRGMGTTLVALLQTGTRYRIANVGDSRAYRIDGSGVRQMTADHTVLAEAERAGGEVLENAERSKWRNALTRALGTERTVEVDLHGPFRTTEPHRIVLCSDGFYRSVSTEKILERLSDASGLDQAAEQLAADAYDNGSTDNISVVIASFDQGWVS